MLRFHKSFTTSCRLSSIEQILDRLHKKDYTNIVNLIQTSSLNPAAYNTILKHCIQEKHPPAINLQIGEASYIKSRKSIHRTLLSLRYSSDLEVLAAVKRFWDKTVNDKEKDLATTSAYYSIFVNGYILLKQPELAVDTYIKAYKTLKSKSDENVADLLPTSDLFRYLIKRSHTEGLERCLREVHTDLEKSSTSADPPGSPCSSGAFGAISSASASAASSPFWQEIISIAINESDYTLTTTIFDVYLMENVDTGLLMDNEQILFDETLTPGFKVSEAQVFEILRILAANGDIPRCVSVIEKIYVQRVMSGLRGLDKHMCIVTVEAYCGDPDASIQRVLDVIGGFVNKVDDISYKDVTHFVSNKFITVEDTTNDQKFTGNTLAHIETLVKFTNSQIQYIQQQNLPPKTITIFLNCLLNHINVHQNFSGIVRVLTELEQYNKNFKAEWFDEDSMDVILNSLSNSSSAKVCSLHMFQYLKPKGITTTQYYYLIKSILRGNFHSQLQYYLHHYFEDHKHLTPRLEELLRDLPLTTSEIEPIINDTASEAVPTSKREQALTKRGYNYNFDQRDTNYVKYLFSL